MLPVSLTCGSSWYNWRAFPRDAPISGRLGMQLLPAASPAPQHIPGGGDLWSSPSGEQISPLSITASARGAAVGAGNTETPS